MSNWKRKRLREAMRQARRDGHVLGACDIGECTRRARIAHQCRTCEALRSAGKMGSVYTVQACTTHNDEALRRIKKHALVSHPANLLKAFVAGLRGEEL
jgi:hypothetical protein